MWKKIVQNKRTGKNVERLELFQNIIQYLEIEGYKSSLLYKQKTVQKLYNSYEASILLIFIDKYKDNYFLYWTQI